VGNAIKTKHEGIMDGWQSWIVAATKVQMGMAHALWNPAILEVIVENFERNNPIGI